MTPDAYRFELGQIDIRGNRVPLFTRKLLQFAEIDNVGFALVVQGRLLRRVQDDMQVGTLIAGLEAAIEDKVALPVFHDNPSTARGRLFSGDKGTGGGQEHGSGLADIAAAAGGGLKSLSSGGSGNAGRCLRQDHGFSLVDIAAAGGGGLEGLSGAGQGQSKGEGSKSGEGSDLVFHDGLDWIEWGGC